MKSMIDPKTVIAILVIIGGFLLLGVYAIRNETPDPVIIAVVAPLMGSAVGYFFGRVNGAAEANLISVLSAVRQNSSTLQGIVEKQS